MDLSDWRVCDRLCRRRRCTPAGDLHNRNVFPGEQGDSNLYGYDCIQYRKLYHYFSGKLYYENRRCRILLLNMGVTIVGILLALYVKRNKK